MHALDRLFTHHPRQAGLWLALSLLLIGAFAAIASGAPPDAVTGEGCTAPYASAETGLRLGRHRQILSQASPSTDVVLLGDSITAGWPQELAASAFPNAHVLNAGVPGDRVEHLLWRLRSARMAVLRPRAVVLLIGTNNLPRHAPCKVAAGITAVLERIDRLWQRPRIDLVAVLPRGRGVEAFGAARQELNRRIAAIAAQRPGTEFIAADEAISCGFAPGCPNYQVDGLHLTRAGYAVLSRAVAAGGRRERVLPRTGQVARR